MIGKPKYTEGDIVKFSFKYYDDNWYEEKGIIAIVDEYGTFENNSDVSYDILNKEDKLLYKHIQEKYVLEKIGEVNPDTIWN